MGIGGKYIAAVATLALSACVSQPAAVSPVKQDISFIGGCWEQHEAGNADFFRILRDRDHPGGFVGDQLEIRDGQPKHSSRWVFSPDGNSIAWESTAGMADQINSYTSAPDLAAEDRIIPAGAQAAFFWDRPGDIYLKVMRQEDMLRVSSHPARDSKPRYALANAVIFEGRLSGCD